MWTWFYKLASPPYVYRTAAVLTPWFMTVAALTIGYGSIGGLIFATVATLMFVPVVFSMIHKKQGTKAAALPETVNAH